MLEQKGIAFQYREYTEQPLSVCEIRVLLRQLDTPPMAILRTHDAKYAALGLNGKESNEELILLMSKYPTLMQRPIGIFGNRAVLGRPIEHLVKLVESVDNLDQ